MDIAIVDDEEKWRAGSIEEVRKHIGTKDNIVAYRSGVEFLEADKPYDVVLMDVEMPGLDGFDTIMSYQRLRENGFVMILTTHLDCARKGYLVNAFRYIDKLAMAEELSEAFERIKEIRTKEQYFLTVFMEDKVKNILAKDIFYIETEGKHSVVTTADGRYHCNKRINELEEELVAHSFFKCHKSFLINLDRVEYLDKEFAHFENGKKAYISVRKYVETKRNYIKARKATANM